MLIYLETSTKSSTKKDEENNLQARTLLEYFHPGQQFSRRRWFLLLAQEIVPEPLCQPVADEDMHEMSPIVCATPAWVYDLVVKDKAPTLVRSREEGRLDEEDALFRSANLGSRWSSEWLMWKYLQSMNSKRTPIRIDRACIKSKYASG